MFYQKRRRIDLEAELRKHQDILRAAGRGVFLFGIWSIIKMVLTFSLTDAKGELMGADFTTGDKIVVLITYIVIFGGELLLRGYIMRCAEAESRGERSSRMYLFGCGFLIFMYVLSIVLVVISIFLESTTGIDECIVTIIVDATALSMLIETIHSTRYVRKLMAVKQKVADPAAQYGPHFDSFREEKADE